MGNLKKIRKESNLSRKELSEMSGASIRMIAKYEQGAKDINKAQGITLYKISKALKCQIEDLLEI